MRLDEEYLITLFALQGSLEDLGEEIEGLIGAPQPGIAAELESLLEAIPGAKALVGNINPRTIFGMLDLINLNILYAPKVP